MRSTYLPSSVEAIVFTFAPCFTAPSLDNFVALVLGWLVCQGRHTVSRAIVTARALGLTECHHAALYRFLSRARWAPDEVGHCLFQLFLPFLPRRIDAAVDDTLCHRSGPQLFGGGMHHDAARSTYGGGTGRRVSFAFGHNWVVLSVWIPFPWSRKGGIAVPVVLRLYRSKKLCPADLYHKRTELAREMLAIFCGWLPEDRWVNLAGDQEYACRTLLRDLPRKVEFTGALPRDAALYAPPPRRRPGRGRPPLKGRRLATPAQMFEQPHAPWTKMTILLYGEKVKMRVRTFEALWYTVRGTQVVRVVLTRDPAGKFEDRAFFGTNPQRSAVEVLQGVCRRWKLEAAFEAAKGIIGIEEPRNGWWRRPQGERRPLRQAGPQAREDRGRLAVERTVPAMLFAYGICVAWYLRFGRPERDVALARAHRPWDRRKTDPCFADMIGALRREIWAARISRDTSPQAQRATNQEILFLLGQAA